MPLLNTADAVYVGANPATRVYLGSALVWEAAPAGPPATVPGLLRWLVADDILQADNTAVASWRDRVSGAATQATSGLQPTLQTGEVNGHAVVRFDGVDDWMTTPSTALNSDLTVISVCKFTTATSGRGPVGLDGAGGRVFIMRYDIPGGVNNAAFISYNSTSGTVFDNQTPYTPTNWNVITGARSANTAQVFVNGTSSAATTGTAGLVGRSGSFVIAVGRADTFNTSYLPGDIAEILVYDHALTSGERATVHSYVQNTYAITVADYIP